MTDRVIPLVDARRAMPLPDVGRWDVAAGKVVDTLARRSTTCASGDRPLQLTAYCMPKDVFVRPRFAAAKHELRGDCGFAIFRAHVEKVGSLAASRRPDLIEMLPPGGLDLTLTTTGRAAGAAFLPHRAGRSCEPRLARRRCSGDERCRLPVSRVPTDRGPHPPAGPIKVNMVRRGMNEGSSCRCPRAQPWSGSSSTWTSGTPTGGAWTTSCRRRRSWR
jgi:hypothetical protein